VSKNCHFVTKKICKCLKGFFWKKSTKFSIIWRKTKVVARRDLPTNANLKKKIYQNLFIYLKLPLHKAFNIFPMLLDVFLMLFILFLVPPLSFGIFLASVSPLKKIGVTHSFFNIVQCSPMSPLTLLGIHIALCHLHSLLCHLGRSCFLMSSTFFQCCMTRSPNVSPMLLGLPECLLGLFWHPFMIYYNII